MGRIAVFVDAGYLFAQGSEVLTGSKVVRTRLALKEQVIIDLLSAFGETHGGVGSLLRIYWYDASPGKGVNAGHIRLGQLNNVKMRLGVINAYNEQKGVDSLLIADLIQLAHNRAIDSAVLVSGDEDLRVGVQVAQAYGVRVHLLGLNGSRAKSHSQSQSLVSEADTRALWNEDIVASFLSVLPIEALAPQSATPSGAISLTSIAVASARTDANHATPIVQPVTPDASPVPPTFVDAAAAFSLALSTLVEGLSAVEVREILTVYDARREIPWANDRNLLKLSREVVGRDLEFDEKRFVRRRLVEALRTREAADALSAASAEGLPFVD
jgi:uncharacterized LabA/DUF88 family protein